MKKTILSLVLICISLQAFSRIIYIRNRSNGGLFGYKYVSTVIQNGPEAGDLIFITNCFDPGLDRCRHNRVSPAEPSDQQLDAMDNFIMNAIDNNIHSGTLLLNNEFVVVWKDIYIASKNEYQLTTTVYTIQEAIAYGIVF